MLLSTSAHVSFAKLLRKLSSNTWSQDNFPKNVTWLKHLRIGLPTPTSYNKGNQGKYTNGGFNLIAVDIKENWKWFYLQNSATDKDKNWNY